MAHTHTPGPWYIADNLRIESHQDGYVADVRGGFADAQPNAQLIAAAPDLLAAARDSDVALTWLAEQMNSITDNAKHWTVAQLEALAQDLRLGIETNQRRVRAAVERATGGQL